MNNPNQTLSLGCALRPGSFTATNPGHLVTIGGMDIKILLW